MMKEMLSLLKTHGYKCISLSVQKANYALKYIEKSILILYGETKKNGLWYVICKV